MAGILAIAWGLLLLWSLGGAIPGLGRAMPGTPPPVLMTFWAGVLFFILFFLWPWIKGLGGEGVVETPTTGVAAPRERLTWGQWFVVTFVVAPLLVPTFLLAIFIGWPEAFHFLWTNNIIMAAGIILASIIFGLTPPHNPGFLKGVSKWLLIATIVVVGIRFSAFWLTGGTYYHGTLYDGKIVLRPHPGPIGEKGDSIRIEGRGGYSFRKTLINPNADPDSFNSIGVEGDPILTRKFFRGLPDEPAGKLMCRFNLGSSFVSFQEGKATEFEISKRGPIEVFFNEEDKILSDAYTEGEVWLIVYINPHLTPWGWAEASFKRFKATLGALAFVSLILLTIGLIWYFVPSKLSKLGKQVAVVVAIVAISVVGWGIWGTRDAQRKVEHEKEWKQNGKQKTQETIEDHFASPTAKFKARQAQETENRPAQSESSFERAQRTVSVNTGPFKIAAGFILILAFLAGVRKFVS